MKRLLAAVAAVGMVVGALAVRHRIDHKRAAVNARLVCATEMGPVCDALRGKVMTTTEAAGVTAARLISATGPDFGLDAWLTAGPWPAMVDRARQKAGLGTLFAAGGAVAHARVGVAVFPDRQAVLEAKCKGPLTWRCVGDAAKAQTWKALGGDERWGSVKIGLSDPTRDGDGLVTLATATTGFFDHPVVRSDLDDEAFLDWVSGLAHAVPSPRPSFATMLAAGPSILDMYAAPDAFLTGPIAAAARKPTIIYPSPVGEADVVLGAIGAAGGVVGDIVDAGTLRTAGWQPGRRTAGTADDPDVDLALQDLWRTASR